jgi:alkylation response protein AidB-like acyl-CoA dehydrogenase
MIVTEAIQLLRGYGYVDDYPAERMVRLQDHPDLRGDEPDPADGHGAAAAEVGIFGS